MKKLVSLLLMLCMLAASTSKYTLSPNGMDWIID